MTYIFDPEQLDMELPPGYKPVHDNPTKFLQRLWSYITTRRLDCEECEEMFARSLVWRENIQPTIDFREKNGGHLVTDLESWKDLLHIECPKCGAVGGIVYDGANEDFREIGYTSVFNPEVEQGSSPRSFDVDDVESKGLKRKDDRPLR